MNDNLIELINLCKCSVTLEVNDHRDYYQTILEYIDDNCSNKSIWNETPEEVKKIMIETDTLIELQFYPNTPIGFYRVYHYDVNQAISEALNILKTTP